MNPVDIVVPVYCGYQEVKRCIESILAYKQQRPFEVILINDASPEEEIIRYIEHIAETDKRITTLHNKANLGFAASINRGISLHPERDVLLLNSDTEVANDWLDRLTACSYQDEKTGTVSPFSNNATICSFPKFCDVNNLPAGWSPEAIDKIFSDIHKGKYIEIPTTVGFCMYIKRASLNETGDFCVEKFGKGYGEENDFCMRASKKGWKHILCCDTFVYHHGGVSFGSTQNARQEAAIEKLDHLYPDYLQQLHAHIKRDPARSLRMAVLTEIIRRSEKEKLLFISHHIGGGCEKHIQELGAYLQDKTEIVVIRSFEPGWITFHIGIERDAEHFYFALPNDYQEILNLCKHIGIKRIHIHHTVGIDSSIWNISNDLGVPLDITLHDYYLINANPTMTDNNGEFCPIPVNLIPTEWRERQEQLLYSASRVFVPSDYAANLYQQYFPKLKPIIAYHPDWEKDAPYPNPGLRKIKSDEAMRILVLGALSREKGADILEKCAEHAKRQKYLLEFHLIGYAYRPLSKAVHQYGSYNDVDLDRLISEAEPHIIWLPAQWGETYSYTLSAALRSGLPVAVPDIGAFPERVKGRPHTWIESWKKSAKEWADFFSNLRNQMLNDMISDSSKIWDDQQSDKKEFSYINDYVIKDSNPVRDTGNFIPDDEWFKRFVYWKGHHLKKRLLNKERILLYLLKLRVNPVISKILSFIPYRFQQNIKRWFSRKPIHELMR